MAISLLAGFTVGLSPNASAHLDTGSVSVVTGEVGWPAGAFPNLTRPLHDPPVQTDLNGCELDPKQNSGEGLPVGTLGGSKVGDPLDPLDLETNPPRTYNNTDLCFRFVDLEIQATGVWENRFHSTAFACVSQGTSGATGAASLTAGDPGAVLPTFGAFYGEFVCDGSPGAIPDPGLPDLPDVGFVPSADGHFHGLTVASTTIAFLGPIQCTVSRLDVDCPVTEGGDDKSQGTPPKPVNESNIKHTLACKGEVVPLEFGAPKNASQLDELVDPAVQNSLTNAAVVLECVIA